MNQPAAGRTPRVGFIGLGNIGAPMARRLVPAPGGLTVFDVVEEAAEPFVAAGARQAVDVAALAKDCDVVCVMVQNDEQVRTVVAEILTVATPGTAVVIHSTIRPETAVDLAAQAGERGVHVLDAPVSGGPMGAESGRLAVMVGGSEEGYAAAAPVLESLGDLVLHLGPAGAGTHAKLARNLIHFVAFTAVGEASRLAEAAGIDPALLGQVVRHSDAVTGGPGSIMWRDTAAPLDPADGWWGIFSHVRTLGEKDLALAAELGDRLGVETPLADYAHRHLGAGLGFPSEETP